jgi:DNA-binding Lrp family transcriptional regulator
MQEQKAKTAVKWDLKDRKILYELDLNSRQSFSQIGKRVGLSKQVVQYRINQLIKRGVIKYFYTMLDTAKLGYMGFRIYLKLQDVSLQKEGEIIDYLIDNRYTWWLSSTDGKWDIDVLVWSKSVHEFEKFWTEFLLKYRRNIQDKLISIYTILYHYRRSYFLGDVPDESKVEVVSKGPEVMLDEKDLGILKVIAMNARMPSLEIGGRLKISPQMVSQRIRKMMKAGVIQGFRPMIDLNAIGYSYYKVDINLHDISRYKELLKFAKLDPNITYVDKTIGATDFEFDAEVEDLEEFHQLIDRIRVEFGGIIRDYEFFQITNVYKIVYLPGSLPPI